MHSLNLVYYSLTNSIYFQLNQLSVWACLQAGGARGCVVAVGP